MTASAIETTPNLPHSNTAIPNVPQAALDVHVRGISDSPNRQSSLSPEAPHNQNSLSFLLAPTSAPNTLTSPRVASANPSSGLPSVSPFNYTFNCISPPVPLLTPSIDFTVSQEVPWSARSTYIPSNPTPPPPVNIPYPRPTTVARSGHAVHGIRGPSVSRLRV